MIWQSELTGHLPNCTGWCISDDDITCMSFCIPFILSESNYSYHRTRLHRLVTRPFLLMYLVFLLLVLYKVGWWAATTPPRRVTMSLGCLFEPIQCRSCKLVCKICMHLNRALFAMVTKAQTHCLIEKSHVATFKCCTSARCRTIIKSA